MPRVPTAVGHEKEAEDEYIMSDTDRELEERTFLATTMNSGCQTVADLLCLSPPPPPPHPRPRNCNGTARTAIRAHAPPLRDLQVRLDENQSSPPRERTVYPKEHILGHEPELEFNLLAAARRARIARAPFPVNRYMYFTNTRSPPPRKRTVTDAACSPPPRKRRVNFADTIRNPSVSDAACSPPPQDLTLPDPENGSVSLLMTASIRALEEQMQLNATVKLENQKLSQRLERLQKENNLLSKMVVRPGVAVLINPLHVAGINQFLNKSLGTEAILAKSFRELKLWIRQLIQSLKPSPLLPTLKRWEANDFRRKRRIRLVDIEGLYQMQCVWEPEVPVTDPALANDEHRRALLPKEQLDELVILYCELKKYCNHDPHHKLDIQTVMNSIQQIRYACPSRHTTDLYTCEDVKTLKDGSLACTIRADRLQHLRNTDRLFEHYLRVLFAVGELSMVGLQLSELQHALNACKEIAIWASLQEDSRANDHPHQIRTRLIFEDAIALTVPIMQIIPPCSSNIDGLTMSIDDAINEAKIRSSVSETQFMLGWSYTDRLRGPNADVDADFMNAWFERNNRIVMSIDDIPHCSICLKIWEEPGQRAMLSACGHTVCQLCRDQLKVLNQPNCPECRSVHFANNPYRNRALEDATRDVYIWREKTETLKKQMRKETIRKHAARKALALSCRSVKKAKTDARCRLKKTIEANAQLCRKYYQQSLVVLRPRTLTVPPDAKPADRRRTAQPPPARKSLPRACKPPTRC